MFSQILLKVFFFLLIIFVAHIVIQYIQEQFRTPKPKLSRSLSSEKYNKMMEQIHTSSSKQVDENLFNQQHIEKLNQELQQFMDEQTGHSIS